MSKKETTPPKVCKMQTNSAHRDKSYCIEDDSRNPRRVIVKDDVLVVTDDMSMFHGLTVEHFSAKTVVDSGGNLKPVPPRGFDTDGVHGRDRLEAQFNLSNVNNSAE